MENKIYFGKNKRDAKRITLKELLLKKGIINLKVFELDHGRLLDNSDSYIEIRQGNTKKDGVIDVCLSFNVETDNSIEEIEIFESKFVIDEQNMKKLA